MIVRLTQLDGKLPNLALMKLSHWHKTQGDEVFFTRNASRGMFEEQYDRVYGSAIFTFSQNVVERFKHQFPEAILGGTGVEDWRVGEYQTVEQFLNVPEYEHYDYSPYPNFPGSIGFTARGCRLKCGFCIVPVKEGKPKAINTVADIWRGEGHPKHLHLLDNDFFGQPREQWEARMKEVIDGGFRVCFNQGINVRLINAEIATQLKQIPYYGDDFKDGNRVLYTAWDNFKDEPIFMRGIGHLLGAGINPHHIMVYMLVGYDPTETWDRIFDRFNKMIELGLRPYPMVYNNERKDLKLFQKWVIRRYYEIVPWRDFVMEKSSTSLRALYDASKTLDAHGGKVDHRRDMRVENLIKRESNTLSLLDWNAS